jgi:hypothetical protein
MLTGLQLSRFVVEHQADSATQQAEMECLLETLACIIAGSVEETPLLHSAPRDQSRVA